MHELLCRNFNKLKWRGGQSIGNNCQYNINSITFKFSKIEFHWQQLYQKLWMSVFISSTIELFHSEKCEPLVEWFSRNLSKDVGINNSTGRTVYNAGSRVACAWNFAVKLWCFSWSSRESNPWHIFHIRLETSIVPIAWNYNDLDVFSTACVPTLVEFFQVLLEGFATSSPRCGVKNHDKFVTLNVAYIFCFAFSINVVCGEPTRIHNI